MHSIGIECFLVYSIECISYSIPEARKFVRKDFQGLSPAKEVIAEMSTTHLLCTWEVTLHTSVNRIHTTMEYFLVWTELKLLVMISFMTVTVVMPMDRWCIVTGAYYQFPQPQYAKNEQFLCKNWERSFCILAAFSLHSCCILAAFASIVRYDTPTP